jgi:hypothetical protein
MPTLRSGIAILPGQSKAERSELLLDGVTEHQRAEF